MKEYNVDTNMNLDKEKVLKIAQDHNLSITIRPDGTIFGLDYDMALLKFLYRRRVE
jgi:hypothetical protein